MQFTERTPRSLLALDIATTTGYAFGALDGVIPTCGIWPLPTRDPLSRVGARIAVLENTLGEFLEKRKPELVVIAERFIGRTASNEVVLLLCALDGAVYGECWRARIPLRVQPESQVRSEMLGKRPRGTDWKALALGWCEGQGIDAIGHDAAEAALLWRWSRDEIVRRATV